MLFHIRKSQTFGKNSVEGKILVGFTIEFAIIHIDSVHIRQHSSLFRRKRCLVRFFITSKVGT